MGKKKKLNYQVYNPNSTEATADYLLKILLEANAKKVQEALRKAAGTYSPTKHSP